MGRLRALRSRHCLEMAVVVVPLLAILVLQYVSSRRLAEVEVIASQTTLTRFLDKVTVDVRRRYEDAADEMLDVPGDLLTSKRFGQIALHFDRADTSVARLLFAGALDGCLCLTRYYDPTTGGIDIGADEEIEAVILRASTLLRAGTVLPEQERLHLNQRDLYVDEADFGNRAIFRFVADSTDSEDPDSQIVGIVGFVIDSSRFEGEYLPRAVAHAMEVLPEDVQQNLIVRATDSTGRVVASSYDGPGQADSLATHFDFVFRDWNLSARSRHTAAAQVLQSNVSTTWVLMVLMSVAVLGGVMLTWRRAGRERRLSQVRNAFVASASHELRTPLASIAVFGEFLRRGRVTSPEKVVEYGQHIEHETTRLQHLIENVLDFARIESATMEYRHDNAAIEVVVRAAVRAIDARRERDGFTIAVTCPRSPLPTVCIDAQAMTQVFVNLLDNAMKYSGRSRRVLLELSPRGRYIAVSVADFGIGIAADEQERVFEEFYRATGSGDCGVAGTGLGLAIVRHVVRGHRGTVEVDSHLGRGSTFTVLIPSAEAVIDRWRTGGVENRVDRAGLRAGAGA